MGPQNAGRAVAALLTALLRFFFVLLRSPHPSPSPFVAFFFCYFPFFLAPRDSGRAPRPSHQFLTVAGIRPRAWDHASQPSQSEAYTRSITVKGSPRTGLATIKTHTLPLTYKPVSRPRQLNDDLPPPVVGLRHFDSRIKLGGGVSEKEKKGLARVFQLMRRGGDYLHFRRQGSPLVVPCR
ncbi:hypothetical protein BJY01DRAFT_80899 [Aspergillus pseudoustus]|uniref:Secreted protein n=1 Tax=Aspergillus pseudoustus TaxID=1810923 RepID=A0ABR4J4J9_9EURO